MWDTVEVDKFWLEQLKDNYKELRQNYVDLKEKYNKLNDFNSSNEYRIKTELEPRLQWEKSTYDCHLGEQTGEEQCGSFENLLEQMINLVRDNEVYFEWGEEDGNLSERIVSLITKDLRGEL